jgi:phenylpyruvate tautomerase PptA (4-oxalocrotonate tautomerase family)
MPLVRIEILEGRPAPDKKRLLQAVHDALVEACGIPDDDRTPRLIEHRPENFEKASPQPSAHKKNSHETSVLALTSHF